MSEHGTVSRYTRRPNPCRCDKCREAYRAYRAALRSRYAAGAVPKWIEHGKASTHSNYGCRCDECIKAASAVRQKWNQNQPHGTGYRYQGGCRCEPCTVAARAESRKREGIPLDAPLGGYPKPIRHGTTTGYKRGCRCDECRAANAARAKARRERIKGKPIPAFVEHGKDSTYGNWLCRCDRCSAAHLEKMRVNGVKRKDREPPPKVHGTLTGYSAWGCRCDACREASRKYQREYYRRSKVG